ncbi:MAG: M23 family metallopeptidase [Bacteroidota bacterium]
MKFSLKIAKKVIFRLGLLLFILGLLIPQNLIIPVEGATYNDYHADTFWYYPWGTSVTHKGVDIFAKSGTPVLAATAGLVIYSGKLGKGGKVLMVLGPKWRIHYYAHLKTAHVEKYGWVNGGTPIGEVGTSGNAFGKPAHLHYTLLTLIPYPWRIDEDRQGWKKMFILNPIDYWRLEN